MAAPLQSVIRATVRRMADAAAGRSRDEASRPAASGSGPGSGLGWVPALTLGLLVGPILAGLAGTVLPSFGILPALGGREPGLGAWRALMEAPGLGTALRLTLTTGFGATLLSLALALGWCAAWHGSRGFDALRRLLAPLLAMPHAAFAIGFAFLIAPSGWLARLASPWATGWERPPDLALVQDPWGLALTLGLAVKEAPFLLLMLVAALGQVPADRTLTVARCMGYGPVTAWFKAVLPLVWPQIRLPVYAVLAYSLSVVDMALILGPGTPPTLAVLVLRWFFDPDLALRFQAAAGACLQLLVVGASIGLFRLGEAALASLLRPWATGGWRGGSGRLARFAAGLGIGPMLAASLGAGVVLGIWSMAGRWRYPDALPGNWGLDAWERALPHLGAPAWNTLLAGLLSSALALALVLGCLEHEQRARFRPARGAMWLLYLPLLVPQIGFLFGVQVLLIVLDLDGGWLALVWSHLLFVLPYVFLALADPWRALDERYARSAACLGASPWRVFWRVKLPLLRRPVMTAAAIGLAVSVAQYLPTLFAGAGRLPTLTTEAVALAAGADRRLVAVAAFAQMALPLIGFALASLASGRRAGR